MIKVIFVLVWCSQEYFALKFLVNSFILCERYSISFSNALLIEYEMDAVDLFKSVIDISKSGNVNLVDGDFACALICIWTIFLWSLLSNCIISSYGIEL